MKSAMSLAGYALAGLVILIASSWLMTAVLPKAFSQAPPREMPAQAGPQQTSQVSPSELATQKAPPNSAPSNAVPQGMVKAPPAAPDSASKVAAPPPAPTSPSAAAAANPPTPDGQPRNLLSGIIEDYNYDSKGKRDPFLPYSNAPKVTSSGGTSELVSPLQKFDLDQLKLIGVIWDNRNPKAMVLDPNGKGYIVRTSERMGRNNGYIARIREGELVIVESFTAGDGKTTFQTKLIKLTQEQ